MRAVTHDRYGRSEVARVTEVPTPIPVDDEVLVRVRASSLNTADLDHMRGRPLMARLATGLRRPRTARVGLDVAGTVEKVGPDVTRFREGDEVWADLFDQGHGSLAEYVCAPERAFRRKPATVSFEEAATVPHSALLAWQGLTSGRGIRAGDHVLVNGAGGCVGPFAIQIARSLGAEVTAVDDAGKRDLMTAAGADHVIDYAREDVTRQRSRYDLILDIAATRSFLRFRRSLRPGGRYALVARNLSGFFLTALLGSLLSLLGSKRMGVFAWAPNKADGLRQLGRLLEDGKVRPVIDRRFGLEDAVEALAYLEEGRARGKVVIVVEDV
ncbi:MAG: NAD(P)-dependent alcohol dehydrogenase [Acidimicrobiia bacterium]|jgi:NADPH:quinone reductase-like Zn-dependent oxidoreductase